MSVRPVPPAGPVPVTGQELLFTPGPRLGWMFRDRRETAVPYPEPRPVPQIIHKQAAERAAAAEHAWGQAWRWIGKPSFVLALLLVILAACSKAVSGSFNLGLTVLGVLVLSGPGLGYAGWCWLRREQTRGLTPQQEYQQALAAWDQRAAGHEDAELARLAGQAEWGSVIAPSRRTDIFGGTLAGWQGLLTVHGASILAERPLLAVDLTGQHTAGLLEAALRNTHIESVSYHLPHDLGRCGLLSELSAEEFADAIAEALHAGTPGGTRADRAVDARVLQQLTGVLTRRGTTPRRLAAAVRAALGNPVPDGLLSADEYELIAGDLFPPGHRQQVTANLIRLEAVLAGLAAYAGDGWPAKRARCTSLTIDTAARSASDEVLAALVVQWLTVQVSVSTANAPAVILAGADEITGPQLERLTDACDRGDIPLTVMFRHLRDDAVQLLGGGTAAFMRLPNHAEAEQAATYIGRRRTRQPVYEYAVDPATVQNLPEYALLLADRTGSALQLHAVECDPAIITLPGVSTAPLSPPSAFSHGAMPPAAKHPA